MRSEKPTVVSTFAGCGGSSLGYKMAGYECRLAVEWDNNAVATYQLNFPSTPMYHGDIKALTDVDALRLANVQPGELDVLDGSPPCQGFSTAGKRQIDDPRNSLFHEFVRLLRAFRPRAFVMENVSGMVKGKMKLLFVEILRELKSCGYAVRARLLNAAWYGVPQSRERMIFIGARDDLGIDPSHPLPTVKRAVTVREAIGSDGFFFFGSGMNENERLSFARPSPTIMRGGIAGSSTSQCGAADGRTADSLSHYLPAPPLTGKTLDVARRLKPGSNGLPDGSWWSNCKLDGRRPAPTVLKEGALFKKYPNWVHPTELRGLSIGELRRLSSFPDDYEFAGKWVDAWARIGNSVPPLLMVAIAARVRDTIVTPSRAV